MIEVKVAQPAWGAGHVPPWLRKARQLQWLQVGLTTHCFFASFLLVSVIQTNGPSAAALLPQLFTILLPLLILVMIKSPVSVLALYAIAVPMENLVHLGESGTFAKLLGILSGLMITMTLVLRKKALPLSPSVKAWIAFMAWMAASLLWAIDPTFSGVVNLLQVAELFALYVMVGLLPLSRRELTMILMGTIIGGVISAVYSIVQYMHGVHPVKGWERLVVTAGSQHIDFNHFAASLQMPIALTWTAFRAVDQKLPRALLAAALAAMIVGLFLSASRGGLIALAVMVIYITWRTRRIGALLVIGAFALVASCFFPSAWARFSDPTQGDGSGRLQIWAVGGRAFKDHSLLGVGVGNFQVAYDNFLLREYQDQFQGWSRESNSQFICTTTELGVVGLCLLALAVGGQLRSLRVIGPQHSFFYLRIGLEAGMLALVTESFFIDTLWYKYIWLALTLVAATRAATVYGESVRTTATLPGLA